MAEYDRVKVDRTISHNLDDRLGATIEERLAATEERNGSRAAPDAEAGEDGGGDAERTDAADGGPAPRR